MREREQPPSRFAGYGEGLGGSVRAAAAPSVVTRSAQGGEMAVTDLRVDDPQLRLSDPRPPYEACLVCLMIRDLPTIFYYEDGRHVVDYALRADEVAFYDMRRIPRSGRAEPRSVEANNP
jgi:hypothetical protein